MKTSRRLLIGFVIAALAAAGFWLRHGPSGSDEAVPVVYGSIVNRIAARGKVEAKTTVDLAGQHDGRIKAVAAEEGEPVPEGRVVIVMDDEYAAAAVAEVRAELKDAELKFSRIRRLFASKAVSRAERDEAEARRDLARAQLDRARAVLNDMHIVSPIGGKVIAKHREAGESVEAGIPILTIADVSRLRVRAEIDEEDIGILAKDQVAAITSDAYPGLVVSGPVIEIGERVGKRTIKPEDPSRITDTKVLEAKVELPADAPFKLGMTVDVRIEAVRRDHVLKIPRRAIRRDAEGEYVTVVREGRRERRRIETGALDHWDAEIRSGLLEQERVVIP